MSGLVVGKNAFSNKIQGLYDEAVSFLKQENFFAARRCLEQVLQYGPHAPSLYNLGVLSHKQGQHQQAIRYFEQVLDADPAHPQAHQSLIACAAMLDDTALRIQLSARALMERPHEVKFKEAFAQFVRNQRVLHFDASLKSAICACLAEDNLTHDILVHLWISLFFSDPAYKPCYDAADGGFDVFASWADDEEHLIALIDPFFIGALQRLVVPDPRFEKISIYLRSIFLRDKSRFSSKIHDVLVPALAQYHLATDYINPADEHENIFLDKFHQELNALPDFKNAGPLIARYAMARPLAKLARAQDIFLALKDHPLWGRFAHEHIGNQLEENGFRSLIPCLTPIDDSVSCLVRAQYEQDPYPRWKSLYRSSGYYIPHHLNTDDAPQILVAGCGTGQEPLWIALAYPLAHVVAVDLSLSSLSYGLRQARAHGISNIEFAQADILHMPDTGRCFDVIVSSGVLHHMHDPVQGWRSLLACLKPGGLISVALYSRLARVAITRARALIESHSLSAQPQDICFFRAHMPLWLSVSDRMVIEQSADYYSLPTCRDLLFHAQEHCFSINELQSFIKDLGLSFLGFETSPEV